jgi:hypothetical protein
LEIANAFRHPNNIFFLYDINNRFLQVLLICQIYM